MSLFDAMVERDEEGIRRAASAIEPMALFDAVARFAVLSYSPSQHGKHALIACVAAHDLRDVLGTRFAELVVECAIYAAASRLPWSEPPIGDPPAVEPSDSFALDEIRSAIELGDRLRAERWLARRMSEPDLARDFFRIASEDFADFGHKLIVAVASWRLAELYPANARFGILRNAVNEWTAYREPPEAIAPGAATDLPQRLIDEIDAERGAIDAFHRLALYDAAVVAAAIGHDSTAEERAIVSLSGSLREVSPTAVRQRRPTPLPIYSLARDCGEYLKAWAIRERLRDRLAEDDLERMVRAARYNLDEGPSMEEWSFA